MEVVVEVQEESLSWLGCPKSDIDTVTVGSRECTAPN